ncbi:MAG: hypothetical protein PHY45_15095 [Rhodocyclaceae bacterium]|nr:hypothetical protein [Rhodocyclaceae bacterium]
MTPLPEQAKRKEISHRSPTTSRVEIAGRLVLTDAIPRVNAMLSYKDCIDMVDLRREDFRNMREGTTLPEMLAIQEGYCRQRSEHEKPADGAASPQNERREPEAGVQRKQTLP